MGFFGDGIFLRGMGYPTKKPLLSEEFNSSRKLKVNFKNFDLKYSYFMFFSFWIFFLQISYFLFATCFILNVKKCNLSNLKFFKVCQTSKFRPKILLSSVWQMKLRSINFFAVLIWVSIHNFRRGLADLPFSKSFKIFLHISEMKSWSLILPIERGLTDSAILNYYFPKFNEKGTQGLNSNLKGSLWSWLDQTGPPLTFRPGPKMTPFEKLSV